MPILSVTKEKNKSNQNSHDTWDKPLSQINPYNYTNNKQALSDKVIYYTQPWGSSKVQFSNQSLWTHKARKGRVSIVRRKQTTEIRSPTFRNFPSSTNFLRGPWIVEFTVDLGELSAPTVLILKLYGCTFLHKGGGATPDNYKRFELSTIRKKNEHQA